jgi:hypothetical protein
MKMNKLAALCAFALLACGCGKGEQTISTPGGDVKVTQKAGTTSLEMTGKGEKQVNIAANDRGVALPDKFPSDIPIMTGAIVKMAMSTGDSLSVYFSVTASQPDAVKYYEENLKARGWEIGTTVKTGESAMMSAKKGKRECVMNVIKQDTGTVVHVIVPSETS